MPSNQEQSEIVGEQHELILRLRRRLAIVSCVAAAAIVGCVCMSLMFAAAASKGKSGHSLRDEAILQQQRAMQAQQAAIVQTLRAQQAEAMAMEAAEGAQRQADPAMEAGMSSGAAAENEGPVVAPVPVVE